MDISHRNLRFGLQKMGPEFAEVGHLGVASFANPLTAGFLAVAVMAGKVYNDWQKMRDAIETAVDVSGIDRVTRALGADGMLKALIDGGVAAEEFWGKIGRLTTAQESLKEKTDDATKAIKDQTEATDKTLSANEKAELAELKLAKAKGLISGEEYESRKAGIMDRYEGQRANSKAIEADRIIEERQKELEGQKGIVAAGPDVVGEKQRAAEEAAGNLAGEKTSLDEWKKKLEELDKWFKEKGTAAMGSREGRETYAEQEKARILALTEIENREQGTLPAAQTKAKSTAEDLAAAQRKVEDATKRTAELERELANLRAARSRDATTAMETGAAHRRERSAEGQAAEWESALRTPQGKLFNDVAAAERTLQQGGQLSFAQNANIHEAARLLTQAHVANVDAMLEALATNRNLILQLTKQIRSLGGPP
jgi:hypothetical protein